MTTEPVTAARVLVVDDEPDIRTVLRTFLEVEGWIVEEVACGAEALLRCRGEPFDLIILDHGLPDMAGIDVARWLLEQAVPTPIVVFTAYLTPELKARCVELGLPAVDKINWDDLVLTCRSLVEARPVLRPRSRSIAQARAGRPWLAGPRQGASLASATPG